jgi:hypothetical protein
MNFGKTYWTLTAVTVLASLIWEKVSVNQRTRWTNRLKLFPIENKLFVTSYA